MKKAIVFISLMPTVFFIFFIGFVYAGDTVPHGAEIIAPCPADGRAAPRVCTRGIVCRYPSYQLHSADPGWRRSPGEELIWRYYDIDVIGKYSSESVGQPCTIGHIDGICGNDGKCYYPISHFEKECYGNKVFWKNSRGDQEELIEVCSDAGCKNGVCLVSKEQPKADPYEDPVNKPDDDFPLDDPRNMFCQPPSDAATFSSHKYGVPVAQAQGYYNYSVVTRVEGEVLYYAKKLKRWVPVYMGQRLMMGDRIKTERNGRCEIKFANSAMYRLRPLSQLEFVDVTDPCHCDTKVTGYLNMKFGKAWKKLTPNLNDPCAHTIRTPTAIAGGGRDTGRPMYNFNEFDAPILIPRAAAEDGSITLHVAHDEETNISRFYVEKGSVYVADSQQTVSIALAAGEQIAVAPDTVPHDMDIEPVIQEKGQWWEEWEDDSGLSIFVPIVLYILGIVFVIRRVLKSKRGIFMKTGMFILGFILMNFIVGFLMLFV